MRELGHIFYILTILCNNGLHLIILHAVTSFKFNDLDTISMFVSQYF